MLRYKLIELKKTLIDQSILVQKMIEQSFQGLIRNNPALLEEISLLEKQVNLKEIEIEQNCTNIMALYHPEARDLRSVLMVLSMNKDLERMADLAQDNACSALFLLKHPCLRTMIDLAVMAQKTIRMLRESITAFINEDPELAEQVCRLDDEVDELKIRIFKTLLTEVLPDKLSLESAFHLNNIAQNLEKIADLSTNLAEDTVFIARGIIVKHNITRDFESGGIKCLK